MVERLGTSNGSGCIRPKATQLNREMNEVDSSFELVTLRLSTEVEYLVEPANKIKTEIIRNKNGEGGFGSFSLRCAWAEQSVVKVAMVDVW